MKIILNIFHTVSVFLRDVFIDDIEYFYAIEAKPKNRIQHYRDEFPGFLLDNVFIGCEYSQIQKVLEVYKYGSRREYGDIFVSLFQDILDKIPLDKNNNIVLTTVPMHWSRYGIRWFDHMQYIAKRLSKNIGIPYIQYLNTKFSHRQSHLDRNKRLQNRSNHFSIKSKEVILPESIIILDDVISTWSTVHECARVYRNYNTDIRIHGIFLSSNN